MKMKLKRGAFWLTAIFLLLLLSACGKDPESDAQGSAPVLQVSIETEAAKDSVIRRLIEDETLRSRLEEELQAELSLDVWELSTNADSVYNIRFSGVLLTDDPLQISSLSNAHRLRELDNSLVMPDYQMGRFRGRQYGYVLGKRSSREDTPVLAVRSDLMEKYGFRDVDFTPEAVLDLLQQLSGEVQCPLAVYGKPTDEGFALLMALFGVSPIGGWEFYPEGDQLTYDKISERGEAYLRYVRQLYESGLIPASCLSMTKYSAIEMLGYGQSVLAIFPGAEYARMAAEIGERTGRRIVLAELPTDTEFLQNDSCQRLLGLISQDCENADLALRFLQKLAALKADSTAAPRGTAREDYPLFKKAEVSVPKVDISASVLPDIRMLFEKKNLDQTYLIQTYCQVMVGIQPFETFDFMRQEWIADHSTPHTNITSGETVLKLFGQWYAQNG